MKRSARCLVAALLAAGIVVPTPPAEAEICTIDNVPAATLLLPYFAVDTAGGGVDTTFSITNTEPRRTTAQVRLFDDRGRALMEFPVALPGHGGVTISLRDVFDGNLPPGAADCLLLRGAALAGEALSLGRLQRLDTFKGYATIDSVNDPCWDGSGEYFISGGRGVASNRNELSGVYQRSNESGSSEGFTMVHIEAFSNALELTTPGNRTFYGPQVGFDASDNREPLGTVWGARFDTSARNSAYIQVWKEPGSTGARSIVFFDEDGNRIDLDPRGVFDRVSQEVRIGRSQLPTGKTRGWLNMDFGVQAAVIVRQDFKKRRSIFPATQRGSSPCGIAAR